MNKCWWKCLRKKLKFKIINKCLKFKKMIVEKFNVRLKIWFSGDESNLIDLVY